MFEASFLLFIKHLLLNILIPFFPGLVFMWIFYGKKFEGILLYILSWFVGVGVVAFSLINIQFIHFGIGILEYFVILGLLLAIFVGKVYIKKESIGEYVNTLKIKSIILSIKKSFLSLTLVEKIFTIIISIYSIYFVSISGIFNFNLPTYGVDSFWNRNDSAYNIYMDGGIKLFGDESEILGRSRIGYPIQISSYKALLSMFAGGLNDIYFNIWQWLVFLFGLLFIFSVTFKKTENIFKSVLPIGLIISLPLVFIHSFEGYMDLPMILYCVITAWLFYQYLETDDFDYISLGLLFGFIVSNIKNDGFVVFFPGILIAFFVVLCLNRKLKFTVRGLFKDKNNLWKSIGYFVYFLLPFLVVRFVNGLGFNQAGYVKSGIGLSDTVHREIFSYFRIIFWDMDNYNLIFIMLGLIIFSSLTKKGRHRNDMLFLYSGLFMFLILMAVFLFTVNYRYLVDQSTVNRMFTLCLVMIFAFVGYLFDENKVLG